MDGIKTTFINCINNMIELKKTIKVCWYEDEQKKEKMKLSIKICSEINNEYMINLLFQDGVIDQYNSYNGYCFYNYTDGTYTFTRFQTKYDSFNLDIELILKLFFI